MDCVERLITEAIMEVESLDAPKSKEFQLVKDYLHAARNHYKKLGAYPRKKRTWYTPPAL